MARLHLALLLLFVAVSTVVVSAAVDKPSTTTAEAPATMPTDPDEGVVNGPPDAIGTTDDDAPGTPGDTPGDDDVAVAGPVGSETSYANYPPPQQTPASGGSSVAIGFGSVVVAMAGSFFYF